MNLSKNEDVYSAIQKTTKAKILIPKSNLIFCPNSLVLSSFLANQPEIELEQTFQGTDLLGAPTFLASQPKTLENRYLKEQIS